MTKNVSAASFKIIIILFYLLLNHSVSSAQCFFSDSKRVRFVQNSISSFESQDAVKYAILPSIKKSQSCFEFRLYIYRNITFIESVKIIKSSGDSLVYTNYDYRMGKDDPIGYVNVGPAPNNLGNIYLRTSVRVAKKTTPQLAEQINDSHLFTILSWKAYLHKHKNYKLQQVLDGGREIIEVKLNDDFRNFEVGDMAALNKENEYTESTRKIFELFKLFY